MMEDIRFQKPGESSRFSTFLKIFEFLKKNWIKILIVLILLFIFIFPTISGDIIGNWINNFISAILKNIKF